MTPRVWLWSAVAGVLILAPIISASVGPNLPQLLSAHARPAMNVPPGAIVINERGKVFHRPGCIYVHGAAEPITGADAVKRGYTPCIRCMKANGR